ncbi:MAG: hypothetical protein ACYS99_11165 [Planctomycetota bacterium]|jgi:biopolymer transport protein ExbD
MGTDDDLGRDLEAAYGRDLPGEEFDDRVMEAVEEGGGEHVLSAAPVRSRRVVSAAALVAASLVFLLGYGVGGGFLERPAAPPGEGEGSFAAGGPEVELPVATTAGPMERPLEITITADERVHAGGKWVGFRELKSFLIESVRDTHIGLPPRPSSRSAILRADRRVRWRMVQWVMQACADPEVRLWKIHWAAAPEEGSDALRVVAAFLPLDRGLKSDAPFAEPAKEKPKITVTLRRPQFQRETTVKLLLTEIGMGDTGFKELTRRIEQIRAADHRLPGEIDGGERVPFEEVVRALDAFRLVGVEKVSFVGAPPPSHLRTFEEKPADEGKRRKR